MARYALNLPAQLKHEAEAWATTQGISLNQFILWAVAEKVGRSSNSSMIQPSRTSPIGAGPAGNR